MFEKLITKLKQSLPGGSKITEENEENEEEALEETEELESESESELNEEVEETQETEEDDKKKKISMIIRVIVIVGLGYTAVDHFFLSPPDPNIDELTTSAPKKRKRPNATTDAKKPIETQKSTPVETASTTVGAPESSAPVNSAPVMEVSQTPPVEDINVLEKTTELPPVEKSEQQAPVIGEIPESNTSGREGSNNLDQRLDQLIDNVEEKKKANNVGNKASLSEKIVEEESFTAPPDYDVSGRGLVYNCKDKFWACIDKPGYVTCNKNMKWNKSKGNAQECSIYNVYNSEEDCIKVQKYNVSTNQPTPCE